MTQKFKASNNVTYSCKYHIVYCLKYRRKVLTGEIAERLKAIISEVAAETRSEILELEVLPDHVHILAEVDPSFGAMKFVRLCKGRSSLQGSFVSARVVRLCKGRSSRILRQEFPALKTRLPTLWTNSTFLSTVDSTFLSTVGGAPLSVVKQYIGSQMRSEPRPKKSNG